MKLIHKVFSKDQKSFELISSHQGLIEQFKTIFSRLVDDYVDLFITPLVSFSKNNKDFGVWVMNKLLDLKFKKEHAKVVGEIILSTPEQYQFRVGLLCDFILKEVSLDLQGKSLNYDRLYNFMTVFSTCVHRSPNDTVYTEPYTLNVDVPEIETLVTFFEKIFYVQQLKSFIVTLVYMPNPAFRLKIDRPLDYLMEQFTSRIRNDNQFVLAELLSLVAISKR